MECSMKGGRLMEHSILSFHFVLRSPSLRFFLQLEEAMKESTGSKYLEKTDNICAKFLDLDSLSIHSYNQIKFVMPFPPACPR